MIGTHSVVAIVPARAGSKGIPGKNRIDLGGVPLISWTLEAVKGSTFVDQVIVTSDDEIVLRMAQEYGFMGTKRPPELATETALASKVIMHTLEQVPSCDIVMYLQPTSPFRSNVHIDTALEKLVANDSKKPFGIVSVTKAKIVPEWLYRIDENGSLIKLLPHQERRRQDISPTYLMNGAIYCAFREDLVLAEGQFGSLPLLPLVMSDADSIDIDDFEDLESARQEYERRNPKQVRQMNILQQGEPLGTKQWKG